MFVIIDGSGLLCTQYYGSLPEEAKRAKTLEEKEKSYHLLPKNEDGLYTNGVCGYLQTILAIIHNQKADYLAVCFDKSRKTTFRRQIFPDYKAQRGETPLPLAQQMQTAKIITKALGIPVLEGKEFEADDYAGTLAKTFEDIEPIKLLTKDRDYFQLLTENIHGWILQSPAKIEELVAKYGPSASCPLGCYEYSPKTVLSEIGVKPYQIADWKGISGDPSDNIPGIKGVSDKTAIPLLKEYKTLEGINQAILKACATEEGKKTLSSYWKSLGIKRDPLQLMMEGMEKGIFCKNLAVIKTDVPIDNRLQSYIIPSFQNEQGLYGKFTEIALQYGMLPLQEEIELFQKENMEEITEEMERE